MEFTVYLEGGWGRREGNRDKTENYGITMQLTNVISSV